MNNVPRRDRRRRNLANRRIDICRQRSTPLLSMLGVFPPSLVCLNVLIGPLTKRHRVALANAGFRLTVLSLLDGIDAASDECPRVVARVAGLCDRDTARRPEPKPSGFSAKRVAENPRT